MASTKKTAKVAVITRTKDRGVLLERAIKSIHNQTMGDFIHVIINDAGDPKVVDNLVNKYKQIINGRVLVIHNTKSNGMEAASNKAIKSVDSEYVAIHDDDDSWHPDFLKKTTEHMENTRSQGVVVTTDKIVEEIIDDKQVKKISQERWLPEVRTISLYKQFLDNYATPITFIYKRSVYKEIGYYNEELPVAGDWDFALRFLMKFDIDFLQTEHALAYYHHRPASAGINQNSVFVDGGLKHEQILNRLTNHYLREDISKGVTGLGYYISSARINHDNLKKLQDNILKHIDETAVRLEGHVNLKSDDLRQQMTHGGIKGELFKIKRLIKKIKF